MADGLPVAEGGRPGGGGGSHWLVIGAVAGVGTLLFLMIRGGGSGPQGTTAAGTSINAALGSLQEQQLNTMGLVGKTRQDILDAMAANDTQLSSEISNVNNGVVYGNSLMNYISARQGTQEAWTAGGASQQFAALMAAQVPGWGTPTAGYWDALNKQLGVILTPQDWAWWHPDGTPQPVA